MSGEDALDKAEVLLERLEAARSKLEATDDPDEAIKVLQELAELAKEIEAQLQQARGDAEAGSSSQGEG
jgi:exonuclease VII small subunit